MKFENPETEWVLLGALVDSASMHGDRRELLNIVGLTPDDFSQADARAYFGAIQTLAERERPVEPATVWSVARGMGGVPENGHEKLSILQFSNACLTKASLSTHAQELRRHSKLRQLERFHREQLAALSKATDPTECASRLDTFAKRFAGTEQDFGTGADDLMQLSEEWDAAATGQRKAYLPTGIRALDDVIMGWEENLNLVGGQPGMFKSGAIAAAIHNQLVDGHRLAVFGLEDGTKWIAKRLLSRKLGMPIKQVGKAILDKTQQHAVQTAMGELAHPLRNLLTFSRGGLATGQLVQLCKRAIAVHKVRGIYIDHALEVQHEGLSKGDELRTRIQNTFAQLRDLAFTTHTPLIVVVHFNRSQAVADGPPTMQQFAECAGIERMARLAIGLWERQADGADKVRCSVIKQTEGEKNVHLLLRREPEHALIANDGGVRFNPDAERGARRSAPWDDPRSRAAGGGQ